MRSMSHRQPRAIGSNAEQPLFGQLGDELDCEERIAAGLIVHQLRQ